MIKRRIIFLDPYFGLDGSRNFDHIDFYIINDDELLCEIKRKGVVVRESVVLPVSELNRLAADEGLDEYWRCLKELRRVAYEKSIERYNKLLLSL